MAFLRVGQASPAIAFPHGSELVHPMISSSMHRILTLWGRALPALGFASLDLWMLML